MLGTAAKSLYGLSLGDEMAGRMPLLSIPCYGYVEKYDSSLHYREHRLLAVNHNGHLERGDAAADVSVAGRGAAFVDLNNDGWLDVVALGEQLQLYLNRGGELHWLMIMLHGKRGNRYGYGARVQVNGQVRFATATESHLSSNDKRLPFRLGSAETADVEILWPSDIHQTVRGVKADQFIVAEEPQQP